MDELLKLVQPCEAPLVDHGLLQQNWTAIGSVIKFSLGGFHGIVIVLGEISSLVILVFSKRAWIIVIDGPVLQWRKVIVSSYLP